MQRLEVSGAVRLTYRSLGVKGLNSYFLNFILSFFLIQEFNFLFDSSDLGFVLGFCAAGDVLGTLIFA